jgi:hypothetical protein
MYKGVGVDVGLEEGNARTATLVLTKALRA